MIMGKGKEKSNLLFLELWRFVLAIFHFSGSHLTFAISN